MSELPPYAIDFETYYEEGMGIEDQGVGGYIYHPKFDAYLVSIVGPGIEFVGNPKDAPWGKLPEKFDFVAHNSSFDRQVYGRVQELLGTQVPTPQNWWCTANLAVFLGAGRNLKDASKQLLGKSVDKTMRGYMKGKTWADAVADGKDAELAQYALDDSKLCLELWEKYNHLWPLAERRVAEITYLQTVRGLGVDEPLLDKGLVSVEKAWHEAAKGIPWFGTCDDSGKEIKPVSVTALRQHCDALGIPRPACTAAGDLRLEEWLNTYPQMRSIVSSMQLYRSTNALLKKGLTLKSRIRDDGRFPFEMKYFGCHTGRWSGGYQDERADSTGFNVQNLPQGEMFGLNLRNCLIPSPGHKFVSPDFSQIEPRVLLWLVDDWDMLGMIKNGYSIYEAYARKNLGWSGGDLKETSETSSEASALYKTAKAACLTGDTLVLTGSGYKPICEITIDDMVWDGIEFVHHDGLKLTRYAEQSELYTIGGTTLTGDHEVFVGETETRPAREIPKGSSSTRVARYGSSGPSWSDVWSVACGITVAYSRLFREVIRKNRLRVHRLWSHVRRGLA